MQKRIKIFEHKKDAVIQKHAKKISTTINSFIGPKIVLYGLKKGEFSEQKAKEARHEVLDEPETFELICGLTENLSNELQREHSKAFKHSLDERFASLKHLFDVFADKARYHFFTLGIVFWFISLCFHLFT